MDELAGALGELIEACPGEFKETLAAELKNLRGRRIRIAVIGQVKAGKSTFLCTLIGRPGLLPAEVNPWTTVVTNLHFGHPDDPTEGGVFHFFGEKDWTRMINGDEETRRIAQEMLPGFRSEVLKTQVEMMRARARKRLGRFYDVIMGREHRYDVITRAILNRYVCASPESSDEETEMVGRYSDITERADVFMPPDPFAVPVIISDTPGVNDPFLVRDEFTCRSLNEADIFVVVMSAHQALTEVDIALMRMLSRHTGKGIVIFVNRIDEVPDMATNASRIVQDVAVRMQKEIPDRTIPVVAGSAFWAELVYADEPKYQVIERTALDPDVDALIRNNSAKEISDPAERLRIASGVPRVSQELSKVMASTTGAEHLRSSADAILSTTEIVRSSLTKRRAQIGELLSSKQNAAAVVSDMRKSMSNEIQAADRVAEQLTKLFDDSRTAIQAIADDSWASIRRELDLVGVQFVEDQSGSLQRFIESNGGKTYEFKTDDLRAELVERTVESYTVARARLDEAINKTLDSARALVRPMLGSRGFGLDLDQLPGREVSPVLPSSSSILTLELTGRRGWKFWKDSLLSTSDAVKSLKRVIRAEIYPSVEYLASLSHQELAKRFGAALERMEGRAATAAQTVREHAEVLRRDSEDTDLGAPDQLAQLRTRLGAEANEIDQRLARIMKAENRIRNASGMSMLEGAA